MQRATMMGKFSMVAGLAMATLASCAGGSWTVVKQSNPNGLMGQKNFSVEAVNFAEMKVGSDKITEEQWLAKKKPEEMEKFKTDLAASKQRFNDNFIANLTKVATAGGWTVVTAATPGSYVIKPIVVELEPGFNAFVMTAPARSKLQIHYVGPDGNELDLIEVHAEADAGSYGAMADRFGLIGQQTGTQTGKYLLTRIAPPK